jgi:hypothetical protein
MSANRLRAPLATAAFAFLSVSTAIAQTPAAAGAWGKVPAFPTTCYQNVDSNQPDPFYAKLEAAKAAVAADIEKQDAINAKIEQAYFTIDPMEMAQRMQQWMMSNPQEAAAYMQAAQAAPAQAAEEVETLQRQQQSQEAAWNSMKKSYDDARIAAYAPAEARRKVLAGKLGHQYGSSPKDLANPSVAFAQDPSTPKADLNESELITAVLDEKYKALCPAWWGANGKFHAYMKAQKDWFIRERVPYLEKRDAQKLQMYAMMSTPTETYMSTATLMAVGEYLDLAWKVFSERDTDSRCRVPGYCDGT